MQRARSERSAFVRNNVLATASTLLAGFLGFVLQAVTSHALNPAQFGRAFSVVTFFTLLTRPSASFARLVAWQTSQELALTGTTAPTGYRLLRQTVTWLFALGVVLGVASVVVGGVLGGFFHVPLADVAAGAAGFPFLLSAQPMLGMLQGEERFVPWSWLTIVVALSRLVLVPLAILALGAPGVIVGTTLAAVVTFGASLPPVWGGLRVARGRLPWRPYARFIVLALASTMAVGVFLGADVLLVQHWFPKVASGQYAVVSVVGNIVFFGTGGVASVVFPVIARRHVGARSTFGVMGASLALVAGAGLAGTLVLQLAGRWFLSTFAGHRYVPGAAYLGWYALGMALLGSVLVLSNTQQSLNRLRLLWILVPVAVLRPVVLIPWHRTLTEVAVVSDISVGIFLVLTAVMYVLDERERLRGVATGAAPEAAAVPPVAASPATGVAPDLDPSAASAPATPLEPGAPAPQGAS